MIARWVLFGCAFFCTFASSGFAQAVTTVRYFGDSFRRSYYDCDAGASGTLLLFSTAGWGDFGFRRRAGESCVGRRPSGDPVSGAQHPRAHGSAAPLSVRPHRQAASRGSGYTDSYSVISGWLRCRPHPRTGRQILVQPAAAQWPSGRAGDHLQPLQSQLQGLAPCQDVLAECADLRALVAVIPTVVGSSLSCCGTPSSSPTSLFIATRI
jgi:hypothetical protein